MTAPKQEWLDTVVVLLMEAIYAQGAEDEELSFEEVQERLTYTLNEVAKAFEYNELNKRKTTAHQVEIGGKVYRRLNQPSSETYFSEHGSYRIEESLYRQIGVRNGPTVRILREQIGAITKNMTPRLARIIGELSSDLTSREIHRVLTSLGFCPPSRSYIEKHLKAMAAELADDAAELEKRVQAVEELPDNIASVSGGIDRKAVPMTEPLPETATPKPLKKPRSKPYQRKAPDPIQVNYRMVWCGSVTVYDDNGDALKTWRMATDASAEVHQFAARITSQLATIAKARPGIPVVVVQDGAKELRALPEQVRQSVANTNNEVHQRIDFIHLVQYLAKVVKACEPQGDPNNMLDWYRHQLLRDDDAIERIYNALCRKFTSYEQLKERDEELDAAQKDAYDAVKDAISYIKDRRPFMRYASLRTQGLPIASGATESTCKLMGQRTNRSGMRWSEQGLRGILTIRGLVLSDQWNLAWRVYADGKRADAQPYDFAA